MGKIGHNVNKKNLCNFLKLGGGSKKIGVGAKDIDIFFTFT